MNHNFIKQAASSAFKVLSRDRVSNIPFQNAVPVPCSWFHAVYLKFLEYLLGVEHEVGRNADDRRSVLMSP